MKTETVSCEAIQNGDVLIQNGHRWKVKDITRNLSIPKTDSNAVEMVLLNLDTRNERTRYCRGDMYPLVRDKHIKKGGHE